MRKSVVLLAALLTLLFGCGRQPDEPPQSPLAGRGSSYEATATISGRELAATATISQQSPDACRVTFHSPETIRDMAFVFDRDGVDVSYRGLDFRFDTGSLPGGAVAKMAVGALNKAMRGDDDCTVSLTEAGVELAGTIEAGAFTLLLDADTGSLLKLSVPGEELEITFDNFRFLD